MSILRLGIIIDQQCIDHLFQLHHCIGSLYTCLSFFVGILNEADLINKVLRWDNVFLFTSSRLDIKKGVVTEKHT